MLGDVFGNSKATSIANSPLNPALYAGLCHRYGKDNVTILAPGESITWSTRPARPGEGDGTGVRREVSHAGEEYELCCPFCKDHRPRLRINHRFGVWDSATDTYNLWLANCYNCSRLSEYDVAQALWRDSYALHGRPSRIHQVQILEGIAVTPTELGPIDPPGPMIRLDQLAVDEPNHKAVQYLQSRKRPWSASLVGRQWGVSYCPDSRFKYARDRIIIPVWRGDDMVGWQARYIGDNIRGVPFNVAGVPKYWTSPGFKRSQYGYNQERAVHHSTVVIVEGPMDVWAVGPQGFGVFGKTVSNTLRTYLLEQMGSRHSPDEAVIVILLDPRKDSKDKIHHIERLWAQLATCGAPVRILRVYLPEHLDPGDCQRGWLRDYIRKAGDAVGIPVSFRRPSSINVNGT